MARIKVCHVQVLPLMSGVQRAMITYLEALPKDEFDVVVICQKKGPMTERLDELGIRHIELPSLIRPIRPVPDALAFVAFCRTLKEEQVDVLHTHSSKPGVIGRLAGTFMDTPLILHHNHGHAWTWQDPKLKRWVFAAIERALSHACDQVIFVSEETRRFTVKHGILPESKSMTLYNGVDVRRMRPPTGPDEVAALRREHHIDENAFVVCFAGRFWEQKNPLALPPLLARAHALAPEHNIQLVMAGEGHLEPQLRSAFYKLGLLGRTHFLGWVPDAAPIYRMSDVLVLPSRFEGLPLVLEESLACGLPAIVSRIPGSREVITPEVGFCEPVDAPERFGERIAELANDRPRLLHMREAARAKALAEFDEQKTSHRLPGIYRRLLQEKEAKTHGSRLLSLKERVLAR